MLIADAECQIYACSYMGMYILCTCAGFSVMSLVNAIQLGYIVNNCGRWLTVHNIMHSYACMPSIWHKFRLQNWRGGGSCDEACPSPNICPVLIVSAYFVHTDI